MSETAGNNSKNCPKCLKPREADNLGFITRAIELCVCNSLKEDSLPEIIYCTTCDKRILETRHGSMTQWVFRYDSCACENPVPSTRESRDLSGGEPGQDSALGPVAQEEELSDEVELQVQPRSFPIKRYKPLAVLGGGGTGRVYLARDRLLKKLVAVKTLLNLSKEQLISFQDEAKATSKLKHPRIVEVLDFGTTEKGLPYMVMNYVQGESVASYLDREGPFNEEAAVLIIAQIADALVSAHRHGIYHRDIKPANALITENELFALEISVCLIDFSIASNEKIEREWLGQDNKSQNPEIELRGIKGTPIYMAPEIHRYGIFDARSEIYSLGCFLFETLAGRPPFRGETTLETLELHATGLVPDINMLRADLPPISLRTREILSRCLDKNADSRYQSMEELCAEILESYEFLQDIDETILCFSATIDEDAVESTYYSRSSGFKINIEEPISIHGEPEDLERVAADIETEANRDRRQDIQNRETDSTRVDISLAPEESASFNRDSTIEQIPDSDNSDSSSDQVLQGSAYKADPQNHQPLSEIEVNTSSLQKIDKDHSLPGRSKARASRIERLKGRILFVFLSASGALALFSLWFFCFGNSTSDSPDISGNFELNAQDFLSNNNDYLETRAWEMCEQGHAGQARFLLGRIGDDGKNNASILEIRGASHLLEDDNKRALSILNKSLSANRQSGRATFLKAIAEARLGMHEKMREDFARAHWLKYSPDSWLCEKFNPECRYWVEELCSIPRADFKEKKSRIIKEIKSCTFQGIDLGNRKFFPDMTYLSTVETVYLSNCMIDEAFMKRLVDKRIKNVQIRSCKGLNKKNLSLLLNSDALEKLGIGYSLDHKSALDDIYLAKNLRELQVSAVPLSEKFFDGLKNLAQLNSITFAEFTPGMTELVLGKDEFRSIAAIPDLRLLRLTNCVGVENNSLEPLSEARKLETFSLWSTGIDIESLKSISSISSLHSFDTSILIRNGNSRIDFNFLNSCKALSYIALPDLSEEELSMLKSLPGQVFKLELSYSKPLLTRAALLSLARFSNMKRLTLSGIGNLSVSDLAEFEKLRPDCQLFATLTEWTEPYKDILDIESESKSPIGP